MCYRLHCLLFKRPPLGSFTAVPVTLAVAIANPMQVDDRVCEGGQEVEISLSRMKDELLEELASLQVRPSSCLFLF